MRLSGWPEMEELGFKLKAVMVVEKFWTTLFSYLNTLHECLNYIRNLRVERFIQRVPLFNGSFISHQYILRILYVYKQKSSMFI